MNNAQRLARLETLLARVVERRSQPRPVRMAPALAPARTASEPIAASTHGAPKPAPIAATPPAAAPVPPPVVTPPRAPTPPSNVAAETEAPIASRASRPPPRLAVDDLPDLDLVESEAAGAKSPSLVPSGKPPADSMEAEFEIPSHAQPPRVEPPQALELSDEANAEPLEIDRAPLATATIPPPGHEPAHGSIAGSIAGAFSAAAEALEEEQAESSEPAVATPERYAGPAVPAATLARVVPFVRARARTFRELLERSLELRPRR